MNASSNFVVVDVGTADAVCCEDIGISSFWAAHRALALALAAIASGDSQTFHALPETMSNPASFAASIARSSEQPCDSHIDLHASITACALSIGAR